MINQNKAVLILGTVDDPHVNKVYKKLVNSFNAEVIVLDYLNDVKFSCFFDKCGEINLRVNGLTLPKKLLVWDRDKIIPGTHAYLKGEDNNIKNWAAREWKAFFKLLSGLNNEFTINSLESKSCLLKPFQQIIANSSGFLTPQTFITNDKNALEQFSELNPNIIIKSLSGGNFIKVHNDGSESYHNVMTMRVSHENINELDETDLQYHPHFFQNEVQKMYELRVVVINKDIFAFEIDSQESELTELDWRRGISQLEYKLVKLPEKTVENIYSFMRSMKLFSGSLDLIVDLDGNTYFIECNQDGAWGWLDDVLSGEISYSYAKNIFQRLNEL